MINAKLSFTSFIFATFFTIFSSLTTYAQDCTINAGGNAIVCGSTATLNGGVSGIVGPGTATWSFVTGPTTPTIVSPNSLTTNVTNMVQDGQYVFELRHSCNINAKSQVTITAHPRPATFTAGPQKVGICAKVGTVQLGGVIPTGFTGTWTALNINAYQHNKTISTTNASFSNNTIGNPVFSLIKKDNHDIDPAYYAILTIISNDGVCTYRDTTIVRFCPNPALVINNASKCIDSSPTQYLDLPSTTPYFSTGTAGAAGAVGNGTTVTLNVSSQPSGGNMTYDRIDGNRIYFTGATVPGTYLFTITVATCCGTVTSQVVNFTVTGLLAEYVNFQPAGHGAPEQLALYGAGSTGGEVRCIAGTFASEKFYFSLNPLDNPAIITTNVTRTGILPAGASEPIITHTGTGPALRTVEVNPGLNGWKAGTYIFNVQVGTGSCSRTQGYFIHIPDGKRVPVFVADTSACYVGAGAVTATVRLPEIYQGVVNASYLQSFTGYYNFQVVSKPPGSATPVYTASNLRRIIDTHTTISNLDKPGDYVFKIIAFSGNGVGPFLEQEYACAGIGGPLEHIFTIRLEEKINSNAGSGQSSLCAQTAALLGNAPGVANGLWTLVSAQAGTVPIILAPMSASTSATGLNEKGEYKFAWTITTPFGACKSADTVTINVTCAIPVVLGQFTANKQAGAVALQWITHSEQNNKGFEIHRSVDGINYSAIGEVSSKSENGTSNSKLQYDFIDNASLNGVAYYRIKQIDLDGKSGFSEVKTIDFNNQQPVVIAPNPVTNEIRIQGLSGINKVTITEASGRIVLTINTKSASTEIIDVARLTPGIYFISITDEKGIVTIHKVLKK